MLSFIEAYSGYNQISMYGKDKHKTSFITKGANFKYDMIPSRMPEIPIKARDSHQCRIQQST
jgi:hypothetical protein